MTVPHDIEAEKAVLGCILINGNLDGVDLCADDFYTERHRQIFNTFLDLRELGQEIDVLNLGERLNGDAAYAGGLTADVTTTANLRLYVEQLKSASIKRRVQKYLYSFNSKLDTRPVEEMVEDLQSFAKTLDIRGQNHREINLTYEIELYIRATDGDFTATECYNVLQSAARATKGDNFTINRRSVKDILRRFKEKGTIQKAGNRDGVYRRVDDTDEEIRWWEAEDKPLPLVCPLGVHQLASIYQRNIGVIAGEPNSGKTAYLLNLAMLCRDYFETVRYFSSEMAEVELKTRISKFKNVPESEWRKIKFICRAGNFADRIDPDGFNIVDFLEITDDFYRIAALIKEIYDRLNKGVCFIAIQKNKGTDFGRGGQLGLEKPRLYMAMEPGKIKIIKAKAWAKEGKNPNGLQKKFRLVQGARFIEDSPWHREGEMW